jgi:archaellum component FlaF (FlaF/FlaG flagellin family)
VLLTVAAVTAIGMVIAALMPAIGRSGQALVMSADSANDRLSSRVEIVQATGAPNDTQVLAWAKNTGGTTISAIDKADVFFGTQSNFERIPYDDPGCAAPCWSYVLENDTRWNPTSTIKLVVLITVPLAAGETYYLKFVTPNGVEDTKFFTL